MTRFKAICNTPIGRYIRLMGWIFSLTTLVELTIWGIVCKDADCVPPMVLVAGISAGVLFPLVYRVCIKPLRDTIHNLKERVKEQTCMYGAANLVRTKETVEELCQSLVEMIPPGWQYPEIACGRVHFGGKVYSSRTFEDTAWTQAASITINGQVQGSIEVFYLKDKPFLPEERNLLDGLARTLSETLEHKFGQEECKQFGEKLAAFHRFAEASKQGFGMADLNGIVTYVNSEMKRMMGADRRLDIIGHSFLDAYTEKSRLLLRTEVIPALFKEGEWSGELDLQTAPGKITPSQASCFLVWDKDKNPTHLATVSTDCTERKLFEHQLAYAKEEAENANRAKSAFLANMSHEIRTPMTAILGFTDLLLDGDAEEDWTREERQGHLETIKRQGNGLLTIINDILDSSKIEAGQVDTERLECSPMQIIGDTMTLLAQQALDKGVDLAMCANVDVPKTIWTDPTRLQQILTNLVSNAIKFTSEGGVQINVNSDGERVIFEVTDTGIGMPRSAIPKLFQAFSQTDNSHSRKFGGTGLGLHISQKLAGLLGGEIVVESEPGVGSTFTLSVATNLLVESEAQEHSYA